jgi:hypothetical protein
MSEGGHPLTDCVPGARSGYWDTGGYQWILAGYCWILVNTVWIPPDTELGIFRCCHPWLHTGGILRDTEGYWLDTRIRRIKKIKAQKKKSQEPRRQQPSSQHPSFLLTLNTSPLYTCISFNHARLCSRRSCVIIAPEGLASRGRVYKQGAS